MTHRSIRTSVSNAHRTYLEPPTHTIILLLGKFRASKRLTLTRFIGLVAEKPAKKQNTTVTCNGLVPRFFSYPDPQSFPNEEKPLFLCNIKCVEEYIRFTDIPEGESWIYDKIDYTGQRIKSNALMTAELKATCYGNLEGIAPTILHHGHGSKPIISLVLNEDDNSAISEATGNTAKKDVIKRIIQREHPNDYTEYRDYTWQVWNAGTRAKCYSYGLLGLEPRSKSKLGQVTRSGEEDFDIIRVYYVTCDSEPRLVIFPWNGTATQAEQTS